MKHMNLPVVERSKHWIVINKPVGVSVHNETNDVRALLKKQLNPGTYEEIYPVHRLDKETSGILIVALEEEMAAQLAEQFQSSKAQKEYSAVLRGGIEGKNELNWNWDISDKAEGRKNPQGLLKDRVKSQTLVEIKEANKFFSLVNLKLMTGRQHQIRKHAAIAKHAIVGDSRYNDPKYNSRMADFYKTDRMFLHARKLSLNIGGRVQTFETPLPPEFKSLFQG
jgi:tRNA pseudouridine65 synthase